MTVDACDERRRETHTHTQENGVGCDAFTNSHCQRHPCLRPIFFAAWTRAVPPACHGTRRKQKERKREKECPGSWRRPDEPASGPAPRREQGAVAVPREQRTPAPLPQTETRFQGARPGRQAAGCMCVGGGMMIMVKGEKRGRKKTKPKRKEKQHIGLQLLQAHGQVVLRAEHSVCQLFF